MQADPIRNTNLPEKVRTAPAKWGEVWEWGDVSADFVMVRRLAHYDVMSQHWLHMAGPSPAVAVCIHAQTG